MGDVTSQQPGVRMRKGGAIGAHGIPRGSEGSVSWQDETESVICDR